MPDDLILGDQLRVRFRWIGDRFAHAIEVRWGAETRTFLDSREGTADEWWPPSPPLQQLHVADLGDERRAALLIGMAGRSHWSLSVVADPARPELIFDAACRAAHTPECLGSRYHSAGACDARSANDVRLRLPHTSVHVAVAALEASCAVRLLADGDLEIARGAEPAPLPRTYRWKYRIAWVQSETA